MLNTNGCTVTLRRSRGLFWPREPRRGTTSHGSEPQLPRPPSFEARAWRCELLGASCDARAPHKKVRIRFHVGTKAKDKLSFAAGRPRRWPTQDDGERNCCALPTHLTACSPVGASSAIRERWCSLLGIPPFHCAQCGL